MKCEVESLSSLEGLFGRRDISTISFFLVPLGSRHEGEVTRDFFLGKKSGIDICENEIIT